MLLWNGWEGLPCEPGECPSQMSKKMSMWAMVECFPVAIPVRTILSDLGLTGYHENLAVNLSQKYDLAFDVAEHLVRNYGTRASWPGSFRIQLPENDTAMCA